MSAKHTPGPWEFRAIPGHLFEIHDTAKNPVLRLRGGMQPTLHDARLLAAAPRMLAALRAFNDAYSFISENAPAPLQHAVRKAREAIQQATGDLARRLADSCDACGRETPCTDTRGAQTMCRDCAMRYDDGAYA